MATKRITWATETEATIEILDGPAASKYNIDIEDHRYTPIGGAIKLGEVNINGKPTRLLIKIEDIPEYTERYNQTPKALRTRREMLVGEINGILDEQQYRREKWFEAENKTGTIPQYETPALKEAEAKLAEFDATHPEIIAAIKAEKEESIKRNEWN
jgi:hypothetical protein